MTTSLTVPSIPIPLLRDVIGREVTRYSLRRVGREAGVSPNGLRHFLLGAVPRTATCAHLERWLAGHALVTRPPNIGQFIKVLNQLAVELAPDQKAQLTRAIAESLVEAYDVRHLSPPRWAEAL